MILRTRATRPQRVASLFRALHWRAGRKPSVQALRHAGGIDQQCMDGLDIRCFRLHGKIARKILATKVPAPKKTTAPAPKRTTAPPPASGAVHPGAFCAPAGAFGHTVDGTLMECKPSATDARNRWRKA